MGISRLTPWAYEFATQYKLPILHQNFEHFIEGARNEHRTSVLSYIKLEWQIRPWFLTVGLEVKNLEK
jgi:hypothetical protein